MAEDIVFWLFTHRYTLPIFLSFHRLSTAYIKPRLGTCPVLKRIISFSKAYLHLLFRKVESEENILEDIRIMFWTMS